MHQESRLIPRKTLFGNPERTDVRISCDGARISYLAPVEDVLNVWVAKTDAIGDARPITRDIHRGIRVYFWTYRPDHIMYLQDRDGDENWHVYVVDVETAETRDLTPYDGVQALPLLPSEFFPDEVLIGINRRDPRVPDLYRVNILTGETDLVVRNDFGAVRFVSDAKLTPRLAVVPTPRGGAHVLSPSESGRWEIAMDIEPEDEQTTHLINFDVQGSTLYMFDSRGRDTSALVAVDTETGSVRELAADPRADAAGVMVNPVTGRPQAAAFAYDRIAWQILDDSIAADFGRLACAERGEFYVSSKTMDDLVWIVEYEGDDGPKAYYLYTRETGEAEYLFSDRPDLEPADLARMRTATVKSRDGLDMVVYYTMPPGSTDTGADPPGGPLPAVLYVHGGPWARDIWGYNPVHQFLANRGYVVISPNFRGSTGFGKRFVNAGDLEWAGAMHDDLLDVVDWAVGQGITDREKVAIMGGSYGGYAALVGLAFTPDVFACAVDIVGPSNLNTLLDSVPPYWEPMIALFRTRVGDNTTQEGRRLLAERSPLTRVDDIIRPLLIAQGANDPRVNQAESDQIVKAMEERKIPVTYVLYPDEGHGFARPENNLSFMAVVEAFLARCLGGRFEPIGGDFADSSIRVIAGASDFPGLAAALSAASSGSIVD